MTVPEIQKLRTRLLGVLLEECENDGEFFKRLLVAQQVVTECLVDFRNDFDEVDEE